MNNCIKKISRDRISKYIALLILLIIISPPLLVGQSTRTWQWIKQIGGDSWDISAGMVIDSKNNLYVAGSFYNFIQADSRKTDSYGNQDIFIARMGEKGDIKELVNVGGRRNDLLTCLEISPDDNLIIGGVLCDSVSFERTRLINSGQSLFVAMRDPKGRFLWITPIRFTGSASLYLIKAGKNGDIYASGIYSGTLENGKKKISSKGGKDVFIIRINNLGEIEKLVSFGGNSDESPGSLAIDSAGYILLSGSFTKTFEALGLKLASNDTLGRAKNFIASFDTDFNGKWIRILSGIDYCKINSLKVDGHGNIYAAGSFNTSMLISDTSLVSKGYTDIFVLKYSLNGELKWVKSFGSWYYDYANNFNVDKLNYGVVTGSIGDTVEVDSLKIFPFAGRNSAIILQISPDGKALWGDCISGNGENFSNGSVIDNNGNLYFCGSFKNKFDKNAQTINSRGDQDIFVAKYYNCDITKQVIIGSGMFCPEGGTELIVSKNYQNIIWNDSVKNTNKFNVNQPGIYWVSVWDSHGCHILDTIEVIESNLPVFSLGNDTSIFVNDSLILQAPAKYSQYNWFDNSNQSFLIAKSENGKPDTSIYWLTVVDSLSCHYTDTITVTFTPGKEVMDLTKTTINLYPNPARDLIYWFLDTDKPCHLRVEITDSNGRILYQQQYKDYYLNEIKEINIRNLSEGTYNFKISDPGYQINYKVVRFIKQ